MKKIFGIVLAVVMVMALFTGCSIYSGKTAKAGKIKGNVLLSINPEIKMSYDNDFNVVKLSGENDDGKQIVKSMDNFVGRPVVEVAGELIGKIDDAGIFAKLATGNVDGIRIKIDDDGKNVELIALMAEEIGKVAAERNIGVVNIELDDDGDSLYDDEDDGDSLYDDDDDGDSLYDDDDDGDSNYDNGNTNYDDGDSSYDDGNSSYDDGDSDYDD
ncbi:MAG: hypothetical protein GX928_01865 [Ruminococcaceae bacterium]|nr:hypothetical protein [Oscillospiraceae bacterium]